MPIKRQDDEHERQDATRALRLLVRVLARAAAREAVAAFVSQQPADPAENTERDHD